MEVREEKLREQSLKQEEGRETEEIARLHKHLRLIKNTHILFHV